MLKLKASLCLFTFSRKLIYLLITILSFLLMNFYIKVSYADIPSGSNNDSKATNEEQPKSFTLSSKNALKAKILRESTERKEFIPRKELADLNYDLYRIHGPNINDQIITAQDPKGYLVNKHNQMFCFDKIDKKCQMHSPLYIYGDMRASILMNNFYKSAEEINLATEVIRNIVNPFPSNAALEMRDANDNEREDPYKKAMLAEAYASEARLSVARNSFNNILLDRLPLELLNGKPTTDENSFSVLSIMEQEVKDRFENLEWHKFIQTTDQENSLKELVKIQGLMVWMLYNSYRQNERKEALLATIVAQQEELTKLINKNGKNK